MQYVCIVILWLKTDRVMLKAPYNLFVLHNMDTVTSLISHLLCSVSKQ